MKNNKAFPVRADRISDVCGVAKKMDARQAGVE